MMERMRKGLLSVVFIVMLLATIMPAMPVKAASGPGGLVGLWHFDTVDTTMSPYTTPDSSGQGNIGYLYPVISEPTLTDGKFGKALSFDGGEDYVEVADADSLDMTDQLTIEAWIFSNVVDSCISMVVKGDAQTEGKINYGLQIYGFQTPGTLRFFIYAKEKWYYNVDSTGRVSAGSWHHVAVTRDTDGNVNFYIDGSPAGTGKSGLGPVSSSPLNIGRHIHVTGGPCEYFDGIIDEVRIWNRALSAGEIKSSIMIESYYDAQFFDNFKSYDLSTTGSPTWTAVGEERAWAIEYDALLFDNFESYDIGGQGSPTWTIVGGDGGVGTWEVEYDVSPNKAYSADTSSAWFAIAWAGDTAWTDYNYEVKVKKISSAGFYPNVIFRYQDFNNFYYVQLRDSMTPWYPNTLILYARKGGTWIHMQNVSATIDTDTWYTVKIAISGTSIKVYLTGGIYSSETLMIHTKDKKSPLTYGAIGVMSWKSHAHFDDICVQTTVPNKVYSGDSSSADWRIGQAAIAWAGEIAWTDYVYEVKVKKVSSPGYNWYPEVFFRYQDFENNYRVQFRDSKGSWDPNKLELIAMKGRTWISLQKVDATIDTDTWYTVKIAISGTSIKVYLTGGIYSSETLMIDTRDDVSPLTHGAIGVGARYCHAHFDDVRVVKIRSGVWNPATVPVDTLVERWIVVKVTGGFDGVQNIVVQGSIGAELTVLDLHATDGTATQQRAGKKGHSAWIITWDGFDLEAGEPASLIIHIATAENSNGTQQYAETGIHYLDGGFSATYSYLHRSYPTFKTDELPIIALIPATFKASAMGDCIVVCNPGPSGAEYLVTGNGSFSLEGTGLAGSGFVLSPEWPLFYSISARTMKAYGQLEASWSDNEGYEYYLQLFINPLAIYQYAWLEPDYDFMLFGMLGPAPFERSFYHVGILKRGIDGSEQVYPMWGRCGFWVVPITAFGLTASPPESIILFFFVEIPAHWRPGGGWMSLQFAWADRDTTTPFFSLPAAETFTHEVDLTPP